MAGPAGRQGDSMGDMSREPSMEDILSSIRRVIARDEAPGLARGVAMTQNDVLELDDEEGDDASAPSSETSSETPQPATAQTMIEQAEDETPSAVDDLVSEQSAEAARHSLEALTAVLPMVAATATNPDRSLEDVVIEALRPMLKQWLDANLPEMVEAMVAREISRITGRRL